MPEETNPGNVERATEIDKPSILTSHELSTSAIRQFATNIGRGELTKDQVEDFVAERVSGVRLNGSDVVAIDIHAEDKTLDPVIKAYMESSRTRTNVVEYFDPELRENNVHRFVHPIKSLQNYRRGVPTATDMVPDTNSTLNYAQIIAKECEEAGKTVSVVDIADRASFEAAWVGFRGLPEASIYGLQLADMVHGQSAQAAKILLYSWTALLAYQGAKGKGIYNRDQTTKFDQFAIDFTQARRLYLAKGIEQITKNLERPALDEVDPQIVVLYPKAHGIRMADTLVNPHPVVNKLKSGIYKTAAPWLNYSLRTWEYKGNERDGGDGWIQTAKQRIKM